MQNRWNGDCRQYTHHYIFAARTHYKITSRKQQQKYVRWKFACSDENGELCACVVRCINPRRYFLSGIWNSWIQQNANITEFIVMRTNLTLSFSLCCVRARSRIIRFLPLTHIFALHNHSFLCVFFSVRMHEVLNLFHGFLSFQPQYRRCHGARGLCQIRENRKTIENFVAMRTWKYAPCRTTHTHFDGGYVYIEAFR